MKPQFALDLSHTGIRLLHLAGEDEVELGAVALDNPDFERHVYDLYRTAEGRSKGRVRTQLLIPNSEVLYTRVATGAGNREARGAAVASALEGMTPYDLDELVFDWRADGDEALVAAVARETLEEAEAFAVRHGFNPMTFAARPVNGAFRGTPDFGLTKLAEARRTGAPWPDPPAAPETAPEPPPAAEAAPPDDAPETGEPAAAVPPDADPSVAASQPLETIPDETGPEDSTPEVQARPETVGADSISAGEDQPTLFTLDDVADPPGLASREVDVDASASAPSAPAAEPDPAEPADPEPEVAEVRAPQATPAPATEPETDPAHDAQSTVPMSDAVTPEPEPGPEPQPEPEPEAEATRKRGAGRASAKPARKTPETPRAAQSDAPLDDVPPMPAFSSRRAGSVPPPPRPAGLPPLGSSPKGAVPPPPPRPKIPPHLAKSVPGPGRGGAAPSGENQRTSRLSALMARIQRVPEGGAPLEPRAAEDATVAVADPPAKATPEAPKKPAGKARSVPMPPKKAPVPRDDLPPPPRAVPKVTPIAGQVSPDQAAAASLTPAGRRMNGKSVDPGPRLPDRGKLNEAESMTLFGARATDKKERSFTPVMIGIVIALILAVAVWTGVFLMGSESPGSTSEPDAAAVGLADPVSDPVAEAVAAAEGPGLLPSLDPSGSAAPADAAEPAIETAALAPATPEPANVAPAAPLSDSPELALPQDVPDAPNVGAASDATAAAAAPASTAAPAPDTGIGPQETAQPLPEPETRDEAVSRYAALGIWQIPPDPPAVPEGGRIDDLRLAALDPALALAAVPALVAAPDVASLAPPPAPLPPAPAGTEFDLDADGLVVATPDGALSPQGVRVVAGAPAVVPPDRPDRPLSLNSAVPVNPTNVPSLRPRQRPAGDGRQEGALDPSATAGDEGPTPESPAADTRLALRPAPRPETVARADSDLQTAGPAPAQPVETTGETAAALASTAGILQVPSPPARPASFASLASAAAPAVTAPPGDEETAADGNDPLPESPYAVLRSVKPEQRPAGLERQVETARASAGPAVAAAAAVRPSGPTSASVAKSATEANVLNLARMNLIGVYGGSSDRRALIRLPSGRFVKVKVGDSIDGGRIASIGEDEVRYVKGGRNITLEMPG